METTDDQGNTNVLFNDFKKVIHSVVLNVGDAWAHSDKKYILLHVSIQNLQLGIPDIPVSTSIYNPSIYV